MRQRSEKTERLRHRLHEIVFEADTPAGKLFDVVLLALILLSVLTVMLESVGPLQARYFTLFLSIEWIVTVLFTLEYLLRLWIVERPGKYALSFFGVVDLLSILPAYIGLLFPVSHYLIMIRAFRLLRVFRVFKLAKFVRDSNIILIALRNSRHKISVFLMSLFLLVLILGSIMYVLEGEVNEGFDSIPRAIYWAIITLTTVGYGDITPITPLGQMIASVVMILGYSIIAVPTGIVSAELSRANRTDFSTQACPFCMTEGHVPEAQYCHQCGNSLHPGRNHPA